MPYLGSGKDSRRIEHDLVVLPEPLEELQGTLLTASLFSDMDNTIFLKS